MKPTLSFQSEAAQFYQATAGQWGTDEAVVLSLLEKAAKTQTQKGFDQAVRDEFHRHGKTVVGALDVLDQEYDGGIQQAFFHSKFKRAVDVYYYGGDQHRGSRWEYRREGFAQVAMNILQALRHRPVASAFALSTLAALGMAFPTLAAIAGAAILVTSGVGLIWNEWQAAAEPANSPQGMKHLIHSGESACCFLMTLPGVTGIVCTLNGAVQAARNAPSFLSGIKAGFTHSSHLGDFLAALPGVRSIPGVQQWIPAHGHSVRWVEQGLMLMGLVDEIMVPFAKLSQWAERRPPSQTPAR
jgi:hypothetical protein